MRLSQKQLRFIIKEELVLVLETKAARNWIAKQDESQRNRLMDWYEAGMKNIPDLSYALKTLPVTFVLDPNLLKAYYSKEYKDILNRYGIKQLKDFQEQGYAFVPFMQTLIDYEKRKNLDPSDIDVSKDAKIIGQVGDWIITDPVSGEESARCAAGTTWCTRAGGTYNRYVEGDIKLYYLSNNKKKYPYNKLSFGVDKNRIRYGGDGGYTVDADNGGIGSYDDAKKIVGDGIDEIISILLDYYPKDMERRSKQFLAKNNDIFLNYINFIREAKELTDSSQRILFYKKILKYVFDDVTAGKVVRAARHLYKIFDFVLKDKEMKNKKFLSEEKSEIIDIIKFHLTWPSFMMKIPLEEKIKKFNLIYKYLINSFTRYYDADGEKVDPQDEDAEPVIDFSKVYSTFKRLYPKDKTPENIRAVLESTRLKAIEYIEEEIEFTRNIKNTVTDTYEIEQADRKLNILQNKLKSLKAEEQ